MFRYRLASIICLLAALLCTGCSGGGDSNMPPSGLTDYTTGVAGLTDTDWQLITFEGAGELRAMVSTVRFDAHGRVNATAGCNNFNGPYEAQGDAISIGPHLASTRMACEPDVQTAEDLYIKALTSAIVFEIQGERLKLYTGTGAILEFISN